MNTIKIFLAESGRIADLRKDFPLYQGQFNDKLLNIFVPTSILAPQFDVQHYIGQNTVDSLPTDEELAYFVAYNTPTHREPENGDIVEIYDVTTTKFWLYVYNNGVWSSTEVDGFGSFNNIAGTSVKIGCYATKRNGTIYQSKSYFVRYLKTLTQNNVEYALYERKLPKEFTKFEGQGENAIKVVANVVNIDTQSNAVTSIVTSQSCALEVMPSSLLDQDETIEASDLERLEGQVNENTADIALKQDKTDATLNTTNKTVVGAINELNTQVSTNTSNIASNTAEIALKQNKQDDLLSTTDKTVVGGINELNTQVGENTSNISNNTDNIIDLQERVSDLENTVITGETYIGSFSGSSLPTNSQLNQHVVTATGRSPKGGDYIYFTLTIAGATDKNYKYTYSNSTGWGGAEIPGMETADNSTKGIVKGSYNLSNSPQTQISIVDGEFQEVYVVDTTDAENPTKRTLPSFLNSVKSQTQTNATNIQTNANNISQNTLDIQGNTNNISTLDTTVNNIISGTTSVGSAVNAENDSLSRNIAQTYMTQNAGATKEELYNYALPRTFNDVSFLAPYNEYSDTIPSTSSPIYTATSSNVGYTTLFYAEKTIADGEFQLASKNSYTNTFYITSSDDCTVSFRLKTQIYLNGVWEDINIEITDPINMVAGEIKKLSLGSTFNYLDTILNITNQDIFKQILEVQTNTSSLITFDVYSNETYPSTFYLNTTAKVLVVSQGDLGELPEYNLTGSLIGSTITFNIPYEINENTYIHVKLNYSGSTNDSDTISLIYLNQLVKLYTKSNYGTNNGLTVKDLKSVFNLYDNNLNTWEFNAFISLENAEYIFEIDTDTTYESLSEANGGTDKSLVTTGEKYIWNNKQDALPTTSTAGQVLTSTSTPGTTQWGSIPPSVTITTTPGSESISDGTNTLSFGANAFNSTTIPATTNSVTQNSTDALTSGGAYTEFTSINEKIPSQATSSNQLADKAFVNSSINNIAAFYITANAQGDPFATKAILDNTSTFYSGGEVRVPTRNDYCIVVADISAATSVSGYTGFTTTDEYVNYHILYNNEDTLVTSTNKDSLSITPGTTVCYYSIPTTRYTYQGSQWEYQYIVNDTSLTAAQIAAINSGITASLVTKLNGIESGAQVNTVTSVNTQTGAVVLSASDVGAQAVIDSNNKLSADLVNDTSTTNKFVTSTEKNTWNNKQNALPTTSTAGKVLKSTSTAGTVEWGDVQAGGGTVTDVQVDGTSVISNNIANIVTNTAYNASTNKIATMADIASTMGIARL